MDMKQSGLEKQGRSNRESALTPPVDIVEDAEGITVRADLPGVSREDVSIDVDGETLTLQARVTLGESSAMQPVYAEIRVAQYQRSFVLSADLDTSKIDAAIRNGVLTLRVPKVERAKPRRVAVKAQ